MLNFVYAFDNNYFKQACVSIYSLLESVSKPINLYLILDDSTKQTIFPSKLLTHQNLNFIEVKKISSVDKFYNVNNSHITNATFYRLYLSYLFEDEDINLIYLDSDIICLNDPILILDKTFNLMEDNNPKIGFADELHKNVSDEPFTRLKMQSEKYFNAGVMLVNLEFWNKNNYTEKSLELVTKLKDKAKFWDQDILNCMIDGNYLSIENKLNIRKQSKLYNPEDLLLIHYSGKSKPWDIGGIFEDQAVRYHKFYRELFGQKFHFVVKNRKNSLLKLIKSLKYFNSIKVTLLFSYIIHSSIAIIKKTI